MPQITTSCAVDTPLLGVRMISHGTLSSLDLQESRRFYEEVFGFEVVQASTGSLLIRKGTDHTYAVVETGEPSSMTMLDHNGVDLGSRAEVEDAHRLLREQRERYGIRRINPLMEQHGFYSFYFEDRDGNWWEILHSRANGYSFLIDEGRDMTGRTDIDPESMVHVMDGVDPDDPAADGPVGRS